MSLIKFAVKPTINSTRFICMLGLLFILGVSQVSAMQKKKKNTGKKPVEYSMTVAAMRPPNGDDQYIEVSFNESARFYRIPKNAAPAYLDLLRESEKNATPVLVKRANEYSDIILRVRKK